jgi:predicted nucleic acid-binding protein
VSAEALLDTSVWARLRDGRLDSAAVLDALAAGTLGVCEPLLLEMRFSALDAVSFRALSEELDALPLLALTTNGARRAVVAQAELAADPRVSHRVKPVDLLVGAVADEHRVAVLHYDHDFDVLAAHTSLAFESRWVAERGTLG